MFYLCIIMLFLTFLLLFIWKPLKNFNVFVTMMGLLFAMILPTVMIMPLELLDDLNMKETFLIPAILSTLSIPLIIIGLILSIRKRAGIYLLQLYDEAIRNGFRY